MFVATIDGKDVRRLFSVDRSSVVAYAEPGFITYTSGSKLLARSFDSRSFAVGGEPLVLVDGIGQFGLRARVSVSESGTVAYRNPRVLGLRQLMLVDRNGLFTGTLLQTTLDVSPDGKFLLFMDNSAGRTNDLMALPLSGGAPLPVAPSEFDERSGRFSPDGQWVAFDSDESGEAQVYVQSFPTARGKVQVSSDGGFAPSWRGDGRELYYKFYVTKKVSDPVEMPLKVILNATFALQERK